MGGGGSKQLVEAPLFLEATERGGLRQSPRLLFLTGSEVRLELDTELCEGGASVLLLREGTYAAAEGETVVEPTAGAMVKVNLVWTSEIETDEAQGKEEVVREDIEDEDSLELTWEAIDGALLCTAALDLRSGLSGVPQGVLKFVPSATA